MLKPRFGLIKQPVGRSAFDTFFHRLPSLFEEGFGEDFETISSSNITLSEDDEYVHVEANLPGLREEDIEIVLDKGVLWIKGEKEDSEDNKERKYHYRANRSFSYHVTLPGEVCENTEPHAVFKDGVVKINFKKATEERPKKISIKKS
ncbi:MAG: Hsp20/alpha crystallin family protein [Chlamydiota bacterium]|nr:Hsp20/alpha crystallin family protein [Chlamydiota bacterium]